MFDNMLLCKLLFEKRSRKYDQLNKDSEQKKGKMTISVQIGWGHDKLFGLVIFYISASADFPRPAYGKVTL